MRKSQSRNRTLEDDLQRLLSKLCVEWGFCIPTEACDQIASREFLTAKEFAVSVLEAEGMNPEFEVEWFRKLKRIFVKELGAETASKDEYESTR